MTELEFSRDEIEELADRLVELELSDPERELLLAIFWAAAEQVCPARPPAASERRELRDQLVSCFLPESGEHFLLRCRHRIGHSHGH